MREVILILAFLFAGILGYRIMGRVDRFIGDHVKGRDENESEDDESD